MQCNSLLKLNEIEKMKKQAFVQKVGRYFAYVALLSWDLFLNFCHLIQVYKKFIYLIVFRNDGGVLAT